jgi:hypothetical protein
MLYMHCSGCRRTALHADASDAPACHRCGSPLTPVVHAGDGFLVRALRERFARDALFDAGRPRFVRDSGPHRLAE